MTDSSAPRTARALARRELTRAIVAEARRQLAGVGPVALSVRSVARELGMASSAVYRYFPSRDHLLTALLLVGYDEVGERAERADAQVERRNFMARWVAVAEAFRGWSREHPHDYALLYGSPVPGYAAPQATIGPATRVVRVVVNIVADAAAAGELAEPEPVPPSAADAVAGALGFVGGALTAPQLYDALRAWSGLIGALTLELFGHLHNAVTDYDVWFTESAHRMSPV